MDNIKLTNGGILCDINILKNGIHLKCKNRFNKFFQIKLDENLVFQKLKDTELIILKVLDFLEKNK